MNLDALLDRLAARSVTVRLDNGELRYRAPIGVMTSEFAAELSRHRPALEKHLACDAPIRHWPADLREAFEERAAIREFDGGFPREEAERKAEADCRGSFRRETA